jgi:hypothetical protein
MDRYGAAVGALALAASTMMSRTRFIGNSRVGSDDKQRLSGYGTVTPLMANIFGALSSSTQGRDPREVADAIFALAEQPAGTRPLRTPVPSDPAVIAINEAAAPVQRQLRSGRPPAESWRRRLGRAVCRMRAGPGPPPFGPGVRRLAADPVLPAAASWCSLAATVRCSSRSAAH